MFTQKYYYSLFFLLQEAQKYHLSFIVSFFLSPVEQLSFHPAVMMMEMMTKPKCFLAISVVSQLVQFFINFKTQLEKFVAIRCRQLAGRRRENEKNPVVHIVNFSFSFARDVAAN